MHCCPGTLPAEPVDRIARGVHRLNFSAVLRDLTHQVVWIRAEGKLELMVSNSKNYYLELEVECEPLRHN